MYVHCVLRVVIKKTIQSDVFKNIIIKKMEFCKNFQKTEKVNSEMKNKQTSKIDNII